ncbi:MAG TPA: HepT-like ribonuclease domain-containing protein [Thermoanaerobaculia bacterium]|nr:HepT-like ribonuclease domain-containing protein [Thermoanaerobaculia bacterium]
MLQATEEILAFTREVTLEGYLQNRMLQLAVERALQIVGEAANRMSPGFCADHPEIPWRKIVDQRNVVVHEYGEIEHSLIWDLVEVHLPRLKEQLAALVPPVPDDSGTS